MFTQVNNGISATKQGGPHDKQKFGDPRGNAGPTIARISSSSENFHSERQNWPFLMPVWIGDFSPRACGTRVESPGSIADEGSA